MKAEERAILDNIRTSLALAFNSETMAWSLNDLILARQELASLMDNEGKERNSKHAL